MNSEPLNEAGIRFTVPAAHDSPSEGGHDGAADRFVVGKSTPAPSVEESLIVDDRFGISPAQLVEGKLTRILKGTSLPVSHLQMRGLLRSR